MAETHDASPAATVTRLACPDCGCGTELRTVEVVEVLTPARFAVDEPEPRHAGEGSVLWETQHWPVGEPIVCRNCNRIDLSRHQLVPEHDSTTTPAATIPAATVPGRGSGDHPEGGHP